MAKGIYQIWILIKNNLLMIQGFKFHLIVYFIVFRINDPHFGKYFFRQRVTSHSKHPNVHHQLVLILN